MGDGTHSCITDGGAQERGLISGSEAYFAQPHKANNMRIAMATMVGIVTRTSIVGLKGLSLPESDCMTIAPINRHSTENSILSSLKKGAASSTCEEVAM